MCAAAAVLKLAKESAQEARAKAGIEIVKVSKIPFGPFNYDEDILTDNRIETNDVIVYYADIIISFHHEHINDDDYIGSQDLYIELKTKKGPKYVIIGDDEYADALIKINGEKCVGHRLTQESLIGFSNALKQFAKEINETELEKYINNIQRFYDYLRWDDNNRNLVMIITSKDPRFKPRYITANTVIKHAKYISTLIHSKYHINDEEARLSSDDENDPFRDVE